MEQIQKQLIIKIVHRHGDLTFVPIQEIPQGLEKSKTNIILLAGTGGHPHTHKGGTLYRKSEGIYQIGFIESDKPIKLYHAHHGKKKVNGLKEGVIPAGKYQINRAVETLPDGLKRIITD